MILHICCAPCGGGCVERIKEEGATPVLFYSNTNLNSPEEFERRLACVRQLADEQQIELVVDPYDHESWLKAVEGFENEPEQGERCRRKSEYLRDSHSGHKRKAASFAALPAVLPWLRYCPDKLFSLFPPLSLRLNSQPQ